MKRKNEEEGTTDLINDTIRFVGYESRYATVRRTRNGEKEGEEGALRAREFKNNALPRASARTDPFGVNKFNGAARGASIRTISLMLSRGVTGPLLKKYRRVMKNCACIVKRAFGAFKGN